MSRPRARGNQSAQDIVTNASTVMKQARERLAVTADTIERLRMDVASAQSRATTAEKQRTATVVELFAAIERAEKAEAERAHLLFEGIRQVRRAEAAEAERDRCRAVLWAMIQQSVDLENEGLDEDDPDWESAATFLDEHTRNWTPDVHGDVLKSVIAALGGREG